MTASAGRTGRAAIPGVDRLLGHARLRQTVQEFGRGATVEAIRAVLAGVRASAEEVPGAESIVAAVVKQVRRDRAARPRHVLNGTGVILHTNLGRAPLSDAAIAAVQSVASGYSDLEFDLETGERGSRHAHLEDLLVAVSGAEAGTAVNNNAAALLLTLRALCDGRQVLISRGQLVEIGGGVRVPDILNQSGADLVEVGTTNRTYVADYARAITPATAAILRVHSSNFRMVGFTAEATIADLAALCRKHDLLVIDDLGSGALVDTATFGLTREPMVQASVDAGASLVCFSGDKLVGGPQAGIIVGRRDLIGRIRQDPLARAVRLDKTSVAALAATLRHYIHDEWSTAVPVWRMISATRDSLRSRAEGWRARLLELCPGVSVIETDTAVGGGSLPGETLPTFALAIPGDDPEGLARRLRLADTPLVGRIERGALVIDPRTIDPRSDDVVVSLLLESLAR